ncbi:unnamed protein product [Urochloa decumbens]|uniref:MATH domain-containing protein n=1 Tax=Urochloa decumbens TaxID=240449 RepID=A0ABC9BXQ2_9POAL
MSSSMPPPSRFASCFVAKPARGFQVLRIDGYSWTKGLPGGERVTSDVFAVGGRHWCVDYYPNGADASADDESAAIALYLRLVGTHRQIKERVRARYKFTLLDLATGDAAYERPEETGVFTFAGHQAAYGVQAAAGGGDVGCGYAAFITRVELEGMIMDDRLAIRCDIGVTEVAPLPVVVADNPSPMAKILCDCASRHKYNYLGYNSYNEGYTDGVGGEFYGLDGSRRGQEPPLDDKEYIRRCLAAKRPRE